MKIQLCGPPLTSKFGGLILKKNEAPFGLHCSPQNSYAAISNGRYGDMNPSGFLGPNMEANKKQVYVKKFGLEMFMFRGQQHWIVKF